MVKLELACRPLESAIVATYVVVLLSGNVADPVGSVSCRPSDAGSGGVKLIEAALLVFQVNVVSWPATSVCGLADNEIVGGVGGVFGVGDP